MQLLGTEQYNFWRESARVLEQDYYGEKVLLLADGPMLKLFRRKSWLSKTAFFTPAERFAANAKELQRLGVPCPAVIQLYKIKHPYRSVVHYHPLEGATLRHMLDNGYQPEQQTLFEMLAEFITTLHDLGIYFRSLHLGNIVHTPNGELGLIDISDMRCFGKPLPNRLRNRNYRHLLRYRQDWSTVPEEILKLFKPKIEKKPSSQEKNNNRAKRL